MRIRRTALAVIALATLGCSGFMNKVNPPLTPISAQHLDFVGVWTHDDQTLKVYPQGVLLLERRTPHTYSKVGAPITTLDGRVIEADYIAVHPNYGTTKQANLDTDELQEPGRGGR